MRLRGLWRFVPLLLLFGVLFFLGADGAAPERASAVGAGSCIGVDACLNATAVIGDNSCNGDLACVNATGTIGDNSCLGEKACEGGGENGGYFSVGAGSCTGTAACLDAGGGFAGGYFSVSAGSCNGPSACTAAGAERGSVSVSAGSCNAADACYVAGVSHGSVNVGEGSCNAAKACFLAGLGGGSASVGAGSCNGIEACREAGLDGLAVIGIDSCNGAAACVGLGFLGAGTVGKHSCNAPDVDPKEYYGPDFGPPCEGAGPGSTQAYGDCVENLIPVYACDSSYTVTYGSPAPDLLHGCSTAYTPRTPVSASPVPVICEGSPAGEIMILPAVLTVQPEDQTWNLGGPAPAFTFRAAGFKNGETAATAAGFVAPVCGPVRGTITTAGLYNLVCRGGSAANYTFFHEGGVLTATGTLPTPPPPPTPPPAPAPLPSWQEYLERYSTSLGLRYDGDCTGATVADAGATCHKATPVSGGMNACLYQVQADGTLSPACITFEFKGAGQEWLLVSQTGSFTAAAEPVNTPVRPAPAPPNTGTGTSTGGSAAWLLLFGALAMAAGGAVVWGKSRR